MKRVITFLGATSLSILLSSCATLTRGTEEALEIRTDPSGAIAKIFPTGEMCQTPCALVKKRKDEFVVRIEKEGYKPVEVPVRSVIADSGAAGMAGNVILGGIIGAGIDAISGATKKLVPNPIDVKLEKIDEEAKKNSEKCKKIKTFELLYIRLSKK